MSFLGSEVRLQGAEHRIHLECKHIRERILKEPARLRNTQMTPKCGKGRSKGEKLASRRIPRARECRERSSKRSIAAYREGIART